MVWIFFINCFIPISYKCRTSFNWHFSQYVCIFHVCFLMLIMWLGFFALIKTEQWVSRDFRNWLLKKRLWTLTRWVELWGSPALLISRSSLDSDCRKLSAKERTDFKLARSSCMKTTCLFPVSCWQRQRRRRRRRAKKEIEKTSVVIKRVWGKCVASAQSSSPFFCT